VFKNYRLFSKKEKKKDKKEKKSTTYWIKASSVESNGNFVSLVEVILDPK